MKRRKKEKRARDQETIKQKAKESYHKVRRTVSQHLWIELVAMVVIALTAAGIVFLIVSHFIYNTEIGIREHVTYEQSKSYVQDVLLDTVSELNALGASDQATDVNSMTNEYTGEIVIEKEMSLVEETTGMESQTGGTEHQNYIEGVINNIYFSSSYVSDTQTYLVDGTGKLMYHDGIVQSIDLIKMIQRANTSQYEYNNNKFVGVYPVTIDNKVCYLYNESSLQPFYNREFTDIGNVLAFIAAAGMFILIIFRLTRDKIAYLEYLSSCLGEISKGNLDYQIEIVGTDELAQVAKAITHMENEIKYQIEAQTRVEKSKNELVTNVAHDLRTPLTSIIGYIGLVRSGACQTEEEANKYLEIAYNKSEQLREIIEDLFELTKLHHQAVKLNKSNILLSNLLHQLTEELMPLASDKGIEIETYIDTNQATVYVDINKITRLFENLIENAIKYCPKHEVIYVELKATKNQVYVAVSNPVENISAEEIERFFERFYRADQSRNSSAGGSGLGLAIAKNIVELHGGTIKAELKQDLICFKVSLPREDR